MPTTFYDVECNRLDLSNRWLAANLTYRSSDHLSLRGVRKQW